MFKTLINASDGLPMTLDKAALILLRARFNPDAIASELENVVNLTNEQLTRYANVAKSMPAINP